MLNSLLSKQKDQLGQLKALLLNEVGLLRSKDANAIEQSNTQKADILKLVTQVDQDIAAHPELAAAKETPEFKQQVAEIEQVLEECKALNQTNGRVIAEQQAQLTQVRQTLFKQMGRDSVTYDVAGNKPPGSSGRSVKA